MDGFKGKSNFFETSPGVYCGLDLIRMCTLPKLKTFYFVFCQGRPVLEIKVCVSSGPGFLITLCLIYIYNPVAFVFF